MSLPGFNKFGDLPPGVHSADIDEVRTRFGESSPCRVRRYAQLERIWRLSWSTGKVARFIVFGSFVSTKAEPNDVDVFLLMEDSFDVKSLTGEARMVFDHPLAQSRFEASIFWLRRLSTLGGEDAAIEQWGIKRDGNRRGIIEIIERLP